MSAAFPQGQSKALVAKGKSAITVTLESKYPVDNLEFQLNLPDGLTAKRAVM
jgi:hypothetical protein